LERSAVMFNSDNPIMQIEEDLLGRNEFSKTLAKAILSYSSTNSLVIGLYLQLCEW
jgi:hypothetical protein